VALNKGDSKQTASVNVAALGKNLTDYLDQYDKAAEFPNSNRPLELKCLKVIALVQDDRTYEILQAVVINVGDGSDR
jgi:hypothetical protein